MAKMEARFKVIFRKVSGQRGGGGEMCREYCQFRIWGGGGG